MRTSPFAPVARKNPNMQMSYSRATTSAPSDCGCGWKRMPCAWRTHSSTLSGTLCNALSRLSRLLRQGTLSESHASVVLCLSSGLSSRSWFSSLMRAVNLSWSCSIAILAVSSRKRSRLFPGFVSTGPFPGHLPNGQCSDFLNMFVHRGTKFGHCTCKLRIVRCNRFRAKFANAVLGVVAGHA